MDNWKWLDQLIKYYYDENIKRLEFSYRIVGMILYGIFTTILIKALIICTNLIFTDINLIFYIILIILPNIIFSILRIFISWQHNRIFLILCFCIMISSLGLSIVYKDNPEIFNISVYITYTIFSMFIYRTTNIIEKLFKFNALDIIITVFITVGLYYSFVRMRYYSMIYAVALKLIESQRIIKTSEDFVKFLNDYNIDLNNVEHNILFDLTILYYKYDYIFYNKGVLILIVLGIYKIFKLIYDFIIQPLYYKIIKKK